jgi:glycolate oxidase FAD binding subunit
LITSNLLTEIKKIVPNIQINESGDYSEYLGNNGVIAVYPTSEEEISNIIQYANDRNLKITVVGMGSKKGYGGLVNITDLLLSLEFYEGIIEHTVGDMTVTVRAGTKFQDLQKYLAQHNQMISLDPAWPEYATIGGVIAANDSGPKRLGYGSARDIVIGLKIVYPNGQVIRSGGKVVKNVAGYDMNKLFIGSMGTLGVVTEITFKLRPLPKYESLILLSFTDNQLEEVRSFAITLLDSMMEPVALEIMNPATSKKLTDQFCYTLAISFEDVQSSVNYQEDFIKRNLPFKTEMYTLTSGDAAQFWTKFYQLSPNGLSNLDEKVTAASLKIGVKNLDILLVMKESQLLVDSNNLVVEAHGGLGHGLCEVILKGSMEDVVTAIIYLRKTVKQLGGYVVIKHLPLALRKELDVWGEKPSYFFLLEGLKTKVDPNRTLNDKRFIGGL